MLKKLSLLTVTMLLLTMLIPGTLAFAADGNINNYAEVETKGVSDLFINFIDKALSDIDKLTIVDSEGENVTSKYVKQFTEYHDLKDYSSIQQLIENEKLLVSYRVDEIDRSTITPQIDRSTITPQIFTTEYFSESFYHLETDKTTRKWKKEWLSTVSGSAVVDPNNGRIISARTPTLDVAANFGSAFDVSIENVSTGYRLNTDSIDYYANYRLTATVAIPIDDFEVGYELDWGTFHDEFTAYPAF